MKTFKSKIDEVAQPLSQGEKNFKGLHNPVKADKLVPGVTDQEHVFKGLARKLDPKTASYEIYKSEDESKENYDKDLKVKEEPYAEEVEVKEATLSAKAARAGEDIGKPGKNFKKIAAAAAKRYGSKEAGQKVAGAVLKKMRSEEVEQVDEKTLTSAEMKKREEIVMSLKKKGMEKSKAYAIATATAKRVAEDVVSEDIKANKEYNTSDYVEKNTKFAKQGTSEVNKTVQHDCAKHVAHEEWGFGVCIPECHTIVETAEGEGYVTHYDIEFAHGIELNVPVEDLSVLVSESHGHAARKSMKEDVDYDYEGEMAKAELRAICAKADSLANMMSDDQQLEAWLQSKISRAKDQIDAVYDYMMYREKPAATTSSMPTQSSSMAGTYGSFLNRMGEETEHVDEAMGTIKSQKAATKFGQGNIAKMDREEKARKAALSPKQKKIAAIAGHPEKIDAADFAALRAGKKVKTEELEIKSPAMKRAFERKL